MSVYTPAQVADETGFSIDTLRYYERIGLLEPVSRTASGRRRFSEDDVAWLGWLRCLRDTGMPIADMLRFAELARGDDSTIPERVALLEAHERRVEEHIADLRAKRSRIRDKIAYYRSLGPA
ncbi:MerR family transcriptional regulator [Bailinhaonella thermotolerans]|uniref:MerR family transcriptional regulator n=1 Tax=Bailinhaonella thermotolerans TaxID=1070861 RepID=A0A3A4AXD3_9ACTN|nr:MerR family transcriptional regulator [Bailinhaonella thermotolerans]RJL33079.1 MerR family transcriptional regulator [Bailinhaonella thermotolerans]